MVYRAFSLCVKTSTFRYLRGNIWLSLPGTNGDEDYTGRSNRSLEQSHLLGEIGVDRTITWFYLLYTLNSPLYFCRGSTLGCAFILRPSRRIQCIVWDGSNGLLFPTF